MIIISTVLYPPESAKDMAECFLKAPPVPDYMTKKGPFVTSNLNEGISTFSIYEIDKSKLADGMEFTANYMASFFGVPGFSYEIRAAFEAEEALPMIGMG
jgi:hypothetical protein